LEELQGQLLTLPKAAKILGRSRQTICEHVRKGHIPHIRIDHCYLIDPAELAAWLLKRGARFEVR
jgi:excisionase family DNA binding protein